MEEENQEKMINVWRPKSVDSSCYLQKFEMADCSIEHENKLEVGRTEDKT